MKQHTITTYQLSELSEEARAKAIEKMRQSLSEDDFLLDGFEDWVKEQGKEQGFEIESVRYSLSNSQGDGFSFSGSFDLTKLLKEFCPNIKTSLADVIYNNTDHHIKSNGWYTYASKSDVYISFEPYKDLPNIQNFVDGFDTFVTEKYIDFCKEMEKAGYEWIESGTNEEAAIDSIEANEYEFLIDGTLYY